MVRVLTLIHVVAFCFVFGHVAAQKQADTQKNVDMSKWITLTVKPGVEIEISYDATSESFVYVKVEGTTRSEKTLAFSGDMRWKYKTTGTEVKVYGAINTFNCDYNHDNITGLDASKNTKLKYLSCKANRLRTIDVSKNIELTKLDCSNNAIQTLAISDNTKLEVLNCNSNRLRTLDVSKNIQLTELHCEGNQLRALDVSKNMQLTELYCGGNQLRTLDVSKNMLLTKLGCEKNQLSMLDVSKNIELINLYCDNNHLSTIDVSQNLKLDCLKLHNNLFSTSTLNAFYCQLPDKKSVSEDGVIFLVDKKGDADEILAKSSSVQIAKDKKWSIRYWENRTDFEGIESNFICGDSSKLTLEPIFPSRHLLYKGEEWTTTVTSTGDWEIDETVSLPDWLEVTPKQGVSGTQVTIKAKANESSKERKYALTFVLAKAKTKEVVFLSQQLKPTLSVTHSEGYTFPAAGETKENYITVESTGAWMVSAYPTWCTVYPSTGRAGCSVVTIKAKKKYWFCA